MRYWMIFILINVLLVPSQAQRFRAFEKAGMEAFELQDYYAALHYWRSALERRPQHLVLQFRYAEAARLFYAYEEAEKAYGEVIKLDREKSYPQAWYFLGLVCRSQGKYKSAMDHFLKYLGQEAPLAFQAEAKTLLASCGKAIDTIKKASFFEVDPLGGRHNTAYSEFGAWQQADTLYYSSNRYDSPADKRAPPRKLTRILYRKGGSNRGRVVRYLTSDSLHMAHTTISLDAKRLYYTECRNLNSGDIQCQIYYRKKLRRNRWSEKGIRLPDQVNLAGTTNTQPSIGFDSTLNSEVLYFVSDRPAGGGGLDIWYTKVQPGENDFGEVLPFKGNTAANEVSPFISTLEQRVYYSGDYLSGLGGYDVYFQEIGKSSPHGAIPLPYPINSSYNDLYFFLRTDLRTGLLSSNRPGGKYLDLLSKACCNDLYVFRKKQRPTHQAADTIHFVPQVPETSVDPVPEVEEENVTALPETLAAFLPLSLYFDNDHPNPKTRLASTELSYLETVTPYIQQEEQYMEVYASLFGKAEHSAAKARMEDFFREEIQFGVDRLLGFSELLLKRLQAGDQIEIFVKGFTSPRAQSDYNMLLGRRRVSSLINHFDSYREGIFKQFLTTGQLVISERSFGESAAAKEVSDDLSDVSRSVYSIGAARERRVEIVEVKRN